MARPPKHPSGVARPVTIRLAPEPLARLDRFCKETGWSRSEAMLHLINFCAQERDG